MKIINEQKVLKSSGFANLYYDILNSLNKYSWMTVPPKLLWKTLHEYDRVFQELDSIFKGQIDYIGDAYDKLSLSDKQKVIKILESVKRASFFSRGDN